MNIRFSKNINSFVKYTIKPFFSAFYVDKLTSIKTIADLEKATMGSHITEYILELACYNQSLPKEVQFDMNEFLYWADEAWKEYREEMQPSITLAKEDDKVENSETDHE